MFFKDNSSIVGMSKSIIDLKNQKKSSCGKKWCSNKENIYCYVNKLLRVFENPGVRLPLGLKTVPGVALNDQSSVTPVTQLSPWENGRH